MASVHITEIQEWLSQSGQGDALPGLRGMFLEIRFDDDSAVASTDDEYANKVLSVDSPSGIVTIVFDSAGQLKSLDMS